MTSGQLNKNEQYIRRCIHLALNGKLTTAPNPMVGAVVVCDDRIIGEGYHEKYGFAHAEVNAIASVKEADKHLLTRSTIYVSLEPCSHFGKTPPCADLIIKTGIPRVVIGSRDTNAKVNGGGIKKLLDAGIDVTVGVLEDECRELNKKFFTHHELHRPFITLKWAQTSDGVIGTRSSQRLILSDNTTQMLCHKLRAEHQAILVGHTTWDLDHPQLTVRRWVGKDPERIILSHKTDLTKQLEGIQSLLVEGGKETLQYFIDQNLWDEAQVETATIDQPITPSDNPVYAPTLTNAELTHIDKLSDRHTLSYYRRNG